MSTKKPPRKRVPCAKCGKLVYIRVSVYGNGQEVYCAEHRKALPKAAKNKRGNARTEPHYRIFSEPNGKELKRQTRKGIDL